MKSTPKKTEEWKVDDNFLLFFRDFRRFIEEKQIPKGNGLII